MKISILGTNGFLSNAIAKYFYSNGWTVNMIGLEEPCHKYHSFTPINFLKDEIDYTIISDSDIIVYASGAGIQSNLNDSVDLIYQLNTILPTNISNKLNSIGYKGIFITFGSYFELGESNEDKAVSENEIITSTSKAPTDYVVSKRMLTRYISSVEHNYKHWHFILPTIYGPGENNKRLIPYTINAILNNEELHFTSGQQVRQYLYVGDVPKILNLSIERELSSIETVNDLSWSGPCSSTKTYSIFSSGFFWITSCNSVL